MKVITATDAMVHPRVMATMNSYSLTVERLIAERDALKAELQSMQDLFIPHGTGPGAMDKMISESNALKADAEKWRAYDADRTALYAGFMTAMGGSS